MIIKDESIWEEIEFFSDLQRLIQEDIEVIICLKEFEDEPDINKILKKIIEFLLDKKWLEKDNNHYRLTDNIIHKMPFFKEKEEIISESEREKVKRKEESVRLVNDARSIIDSVEDEETFTDVKELRKILERAKYLDPSNQEATDLWEEYKYLWSDESEEETVTETK